MFFTPLLSPAVTPMDVLRHAENDPMVPSMDPVYFSPLTSPALDRFPGSQSDTRRSQSMVGLSNIMPNRRIPENASEGRNVRRAPFSPNHRPPNVRKRRTSITSLNLNATNGSQSDPSSADSVSPEPLPSASMPPPAAPRGSSSSKPYEKTANGRHQRPNPRQKRSAAVSNEVSPATPSSFLNMTLQPSDQRPHGPESTVTFDHGSTDASPATVKSAGSTPTFGPTSAGPSMGSPSFISIPSSYDPNNGPPSVNGPNNQSTRRPIRHSSRQSRSSSSSPAFKPIISPNLKPLLPGGASNEMVHTLAVKSNYQNILEGNHNQLGL
jgi:hypothetical protein